MFLVASPPWCHPERSEGSPVLFAVAVAVAVAVAFVVAVVGAGARPFGFKGRSLPYLPLPFLFVVILRPYARSADG